jgi:hypothetical protein
LYWKIALPSPAVQIMSFGEKNVKRGKRMGQNVREKEKVKGKMKLKGLQKC